MKRGPNDYRKISIFTHYNWTPLWSEIIPFSQSQFNELILLIHGVGSVQFLNEEFWKSEPEVELTHFFITIGQSIYFVNMMNDLKGIINILDGKKNGKMLIIGHIRMIRNSPINV